ncbi:hypothetical protein LELG_00749 [Lodderomyces elongisporus NRRL YB-4239]|uniref:Uncharacterized protein n=1 Tax=Lodderomyces elongisporus (strain ATCC 11503 / CBS 2605 / JCM 1781 / NBRC 1676 / NRRL YB-4239) TaxID=379508 RepID=A5DTR3_LODEL|nr:hypothetical protein LELG_00749 [Lodderomyces elongisporus NRRL YB-4239]
MGPLCAYDNLRAPEPVILRDKYNFNIWKENFLHYASFVTDDDIANYLTDDSTEPPATVENLTAILNFLYVKTLTKKIQEQLQLKLLRNKAAFLWLVDTYGELVPFEQIEFIADRLEKVHDNAVDIDLRFTIFGQVWTYLMSQGVQGRDCLRHFLWLNPKTDFFI